MKAPWATGPAGAKPDGDSQNAPSSLSLPHTGTPVKPRIDAEPALPAVNSAGWPSAWTPAKKRILREEDLQKALESPGLRSFVAFTLSLNEAVTGKKLSDDCHVSSPVQKLLDILKRLQEVVDETPASKQAMRYGNPAYKIWAARMSELAPELVMDLLGEGAQEAVIEILPYFLDSFGNAVRIDYGTGHETNFVAFLYCLFALGVLTDADRQAAVTRVFKEYMTLMRKLQTTYWYVPYTVTPLHQTLRSSHASLGHQSCSPLVLSPVTMTILTNSRRKPWWYA